MRFAADIIVGGAGTTASSAALAFAARGFSVALAGVAERPAPSRTIALLDGSLRFYRALDVERRLAPDLAPLKTMRIIDDTGSLFRLPPIDFKADEIGLDAFGANIEATRLSKILAEAVADTPAIRVLTAPIQTLTLKAEGVVASLEDEAEISAKLAVAADGARSALRQGAGIKVETWSYPQVALTAIFAHERPHLSTSTEFHTRAGPFTLVPLPGQTGAQHRSSLVWMMSPAESDRRSALRPENFAREAERQAHSILGAFRIEGPVAAVQMRGLKALTLASPRLALVGEVAHVFPPIGAQGLNLGLRDIAHLAEVAGIHSHDPGGSEALAAYESRRRADIGSRTRGVDFLNRSLLLDGLPIDFLRGLGLLALGAMPPLRRAVMRQGVMPTANIPALMR